MKNLIVMYFKSELYFKQRYIDEFSNMSKCYTKPLSELITQSISNMIDNKTTQRALRVHKTENYIILH